jgi:hypothetical protein
MESAKKGATRMDDFAILFMVIRFCATYSMSTCSLTGAEGLCVPGISSVPGVSGVPGNPSVLCVLVYDSSIRVTTFLLLCAVLPV